MLGGLFNVKAVRSRLHPVMLFAIVFGLSMDYEVFLVRACTRSGRGDAMPRRL